MLKSFGGTVIHAGALVLSPTFLVAKLQDIGQICRSRFFQQSPGSATKQPQPSTCYEPLLASNGAHSKHWYGDSLGHRVEHLDDLRIYGNISAGLQPSFWIAAHMLRDPTPEQALKRKQSLSDAQ
jgi:hypothetical protein